MAASLLHNRYGITRTLTTGFLHQQYLAEDLQRPGNPTCWVQHFRLNATHPTLLQAARTLFQKETKRLKRLGQSPYIPTVQAAFEEEQEFYLVQDWQPGRSLLEQLDTTPKREASEVIRLLQQWLPILTVVHDQGLTHRNLSPASWRWSERDRHWLLTDFGGLAQLGLLQLNGQGKVTLRQRVGQPGYSPPQWQGKITPAYDLYSVGVLAVQLLRGCDPEAIDLKAMDLDGMFKEGDRLQTVLHGLLQFTYPTAQDALQWLNGTAMTIATWDEDDDSPAATVAQTASTHTPATTAHQKTAILNPTDPPKPPPPLSSPSPPADLIGQRYRIIRQLGDGGFGKTFLAEDEQFPGRPQCVVKQLHPYRTTPQALKLARRLFFSEAEVLSQLGQHPQIPQLLAYFEEDSEFYLVQDYIEGQDIDAELPPGKTWSEVKVTRLLREVLAILEFVHGKNVIHRDLKPANIRRRTTGELVLIDFGAVKQIGEQVDRQGKTNMTVAIGTPGYAPSEQTQGKPRLNSDLYALGMIAIQALTGVEPEHLPEDPQTGEVLWHDRIQQKNMNPALRDILDRMVRYDFRQRYTTVAEVLRDLDGIGSRRSTVIRPIQKLNQKKVPPAATIAIVIAVVVATLVLFYSVAVHVIRQITQTATLSTADPAITAPQDTEDPSDAPLPQLPAQLRSFDFAIAAATYSPALDRIVMIPTNANQLHHYSPLSQRLQTIPLQNSPRLVVVDPSGQLAAVANGNQLTLINLQRNQIENQIMVAGQIHDLVLTANRWAYVSSTDNPRLWGINLNTNEAALLETAGLSFAQSSLTLHPNGRTLLALSRGGKQVQVVDLSQGEPVVRGRWQGAGDQNVGDRLWITQDGRRAVSDRGFSFPLPSLQGNQTMQPSAIALQNPNPLPHRFSLSPPLLALDGDPANQLIQLDPQTLARRQAWQLPPLTSAGNTTPLTGQYLFVNPRNNEYYILAQPSTGTGTVLLQGQLTP
ncbi:protein kinase domain-containing protein [Spirulina major]|uniref:protein kinase domain-containing protein n=1 Tax=Spirulina major TaxID=270636 RepID=UPI000934DA66|nr:protein kinase [Spirulina major]